MHIAALQLFEFKNYEKEQLEFSPQLNCIVGKNGMGKTNLLDAVHYLCVCKSYFPVPDLAIARHGSRFFRLAGTFYKEGKMEQIVCKNEIRKRKVFARNGKNYRRLSDHIGLLPVVMIAPDDTQLVTGGSEERRRLLDQSLSQLDKQYLQQLLQYNKIISQRNALLKRFEEQGYFDATLLQTYDEQLLAPAQYIYEKRADWTTQLQKLFQEYYAEISSGQEKVRIQYQSKLQESDFPELLQQARQKDRALQRSTVGPHRDNLLLYINDYQLKRYASQGQLKSVVLALRLAQYALLQKQSKTPPILLLDDIFDKLDAQRVEQLLALLLGRQFGQVFITDTHEQRVVDMARQFADDYKLFRVEAGEAHTVVYEG